MPAIPTADWVELHDLGTRYSRALDTKEFELLRTVWAHDADITYDFISIGVDRALLTYPAGEEIVLDTENIHALLATMHRSSNHRFEIGDDRVTGRVYVYLFEIRVDSGEPQTIYHLGWYNDPYARVDRSRFFTEQRFVYTWTDGSWICARPSAK